MLKVLRGRMGELWRDEDGLGMLEMILIIAVIVIIAVIFRKELKAIVENLLSKADEKTDSFMDGGE
ncbi:Flp1 family type IVb pilin [Paenibacillus woosongensis]|uniref:Flp1 family type IVb pilin n=1 Tax=Paenibacillus woosongensis TaxID=307580 RepID=A0AA95IAN6_9BACL|nr:Flp1 family type IVb pilin [Paenibacillus woosongensis]WHX50419.1 Flp1 family type IVb pilin [Paenibacillus woosongensis]